MRNKESSTIRPTDLFLVFIIPFIVYSGTLFNGFVYDDNVQIVGNRWITDVKYIKDFFFSSSMAFREGGPGANTFRPFVYLVFMAEYHVFGYSAWGYHLVNMVLHSLNSVMVFLVAGSLFRPGGSTGGMEDGAEEHKSFVLFPVCAGLVFGLHPINSEVASWVSAVPELAYTLFVLLALYLYTEAHGGGRPTDRLRYALSLFFFSLALLSKEPAMALIIIIPLYEFSIKGAGFLRRWRVYAPYVAVAAVYITLRTRAVGGFIHEKKIALDLFWTVINALPLFKGYLVKLILPVNLNAFYSFYPVNTLADPRALIGLGTLVVFIVAAVALRRIRPLFFSLIWVVLPLLPVLYIPGLSATPFAERYLYLPSVGFAMMLAYLFARASGLNLVLTDVDRRRTGTGMAGGDGFKVSPGTGASGVVTWMPRRILVIALSALLLLYAAGSFKRSFVWKNDFTLWSDAVKKSPYSTNVHYNLAWAAQKGGDQLLAIKHYKEAIRLEPSYADAHYNLAVIYSSQFMLDDAIAELIEALKVDPTYGDARKLLAELLVLKSIEHDAKR